MKQLQKERDLLAVTLEQAKTQADAARSGNDEIVPFLLGGVRQLLVRLA